MVKKILNVFCDVSGMSFQSTRCSSTDDEDTS